MFQMGDAPFGFFELNERRFSILHHECAALRNGRIAFEAEVDVRFDDFNGHPGLLEAFGAIQPVDRFLVEQPNVVFIALDARHQAFIGVKAHGVLGESRYQGGFFDRIHV